MANVDLSKLVTAESKAQAALIERAGGIKADCARRILSVVDEHTQASLLAAVVSGALSTKDKATFKAGQAWIEATKAACRAAIASGDAPEWPEPSEAIVALARAY